MSMLKKLKSIFIEEVEGGSAAPKSKEPAATPESSDKAKAKSSGTSTKSSSQDIPKAKADTKPDNKFVDLLLKAIEANNVEGFDYLEYKQSLQSLSKIEPDEAKRFQNAFAMAQTMGLDKAKLFSSAKRYISVLTDEEAKFSQAFEKQRSAQIVQREQKVENLQKSIQAKEQQIKKLQAEIAKAQEELKTIEGKINESMAKVESTKDGFYASYHMVLNQIKDDLEKINTYIP